MKIDKYEIDMLAVGQADALLIHFHDTAEDKWHIILVDAGFEDSATQIEEMVRDVYKMDTIDLAICTHNDRDHFYGFYKLIQDKQNNEKKSILIQKFWINATNDYRYTKDGASLIKVLDDAKILYQCALSDSYDNTIFGDVIQVIGPSSFYFLEKCKKLNEAVKNYSAKGIDDENDPSKTNPNSIIFLFQPGNGRKYLFTGDATEDAFKSVIENTSVEKLKDIYWLKVPHHGSEGNLSTDLLKTMKPKVSYISTADDDANLQGATVRELQKYGKVYSGCMRHRHNMPDREGYSTADPIPDVKY